MTTMALEHAGPAILQAARGRPWREALAGRAVTVVGLARSGVAACRLLLSLGARVTGTDARGTDALPAEARALATDGVRLVAGGHPEAAFADGGAGGGEPRGAGRSPGARRRPRRGACRCWVRWSSPTGR